jgi:hypothetical protein
MVAQRWNSDCSDLRRFLARNQAPTEPPFNPIDQLDYFELAGEHRKQGALPTYVDGMFAGPELHVLASAREMLRILERQH